MTLDAANVAALLEARHPDPFAVLGLHHDGRCWWQRCLLPGAARVQVVDAIHGGVRATLVASHPAGFFEGDCGTAPTRFAYRLRIDWHAGHRTETADPYAFGALLAEHDLVALREGRHARPYTVLGAHPMRIEGIDGTRFAVWAPNARRVSVVGSFNQWDGRRHPMRLRHDAGVWELFIPAVAVGDLYKYELLDRNGQLLPSKADPYAFASELRPGTASCVAALPATIDLPPARASANRRDAPISIYEVHAGSWRRAADGGFLSWDELAAELPDYAAALGFTHIELLPPGEHPLDASWGYQSLGMYAPSARFGPVDGLRRFVSACHAKGLGVLVDWVPAHFPADAHGLARFDGSALYEYEDPREGWHQDWGTHIYHFGRNEVRDFLAGSARFWLEQYGVDGLRVDAVASMLYRDYSRKPGEWVPNAFGGRENLEAIALLRRINTEIGARPGAIMVAEESTAFPGVSAPVDGGGLGFHYKWNMGWMNDTLRYMQQNPVHRRWHHQQMTFGLIYAFSENFILPISHDEVVHGKGSLLGKMPGDDWQRFANLRAYLGFLWGHPGKKLLFMGQEFAQPEEWHHDHALPWHWLNDARHAGVHSLVRDLNRLYRTVPALHRRDHEPGGFEWLIGDDVDNSVFAWARHDDCGTLAIVVCNFTPVPRAGYRIPLPADAPAQWREALNTDSRNYGGSDVGNGARELTAEARRYHGQKRSLTLTLPPLATLFLLPA